MLSTVNGFTTPPDRVTSLHLLASGLIGQIPAGTLVTSQLSKVQTLSLCFNALSGPLPSDLSRCTQLCNLYLHGNCFSGYIPKFLLSLSILMHLNLADNSFSDEILQVLNNLMRLESLYLERNQLIGKISELDLPNLVQFNVSFNRLNGLVPTKLSLMPGNALDVSSSGAAQLRNSIGNVYWLTGSVPTKLNGMPVDPLDVSSGAVTQFHKRCHNVNER